MTLDLKLSVALLALFIVTICVGYFVIRSIIWSIAWCDKGGKHNSLVRLRKGVCFRERMSMTYLEPYTDEHRQGFAFWMKTKTVFVAVETCFLIGYIFCFFFGEMHVAVQLFMIFTVLQAFVVSFILLLQIDRNHHTKYDRIRINKYKKHK